MSTNEEENAYHDRIIHAWNKISEETGIRIEMVAAIHRSVTSERKNKVHVTSKNASQFILQDLINKDIGSIQDQLHYNGIKSSEDFGTVIKKLCENEVLFEEENDTYEDFNGQFTTESVSQFIKQHKLKKERDWYKTISYLMAIVGFLIVFSFYDKMEWLGWVLVSGSWLLYVFRGRVDAIVKRASSKHSQQ